MQKKNMKKQKKLIIKTPAHLKKKIKLEKREFINVFWKKKQSYTATRLQTFKSTFNIIYFFSKYWELGNLHMKLFSKLIFFYDNSSIKKYLWMIYTKRVKKKPFFYNLKWWWIKKIYWSLLLHWFFKLWVFTYFLNFWLKLFNNINFKNNKTILNKLLYQPLRKNLNNLLELKNKNDLSKRIKGFLFVWSTKSNFFVTILDFMGNTLVTRSGGNTGWNGTWQWSTVFSADNAIYECCFLAKERGLESVIVHIRSSLWIQQIKHCFEGLGTSGLAVEHVVYRPLKSFGGCWLKKVRWV